MIFGLLCGLACSIIFPTIWDRVEHGRWWWSR